VGAKLRCNLDTKTAMNYRTTNRAFIRVARSGFTTTYKHAGTRARGDCPRCNQLWAGLWVEAGRKALG